MSFVTLMCLSHPEMKLGPSAEPEIQFRGGFARVDTDKYPDWEAWISHPGTPYIENLGENAEGLVSASEPGALTCPICNDGRAFKSKLGLNSHLRTHAPKG